MNTTPEVPTSLYAELARKRTEFITKHGINPTHFFCDERVAKTIVVEILPLPFSLTDSLIIIGLQWIETTPGPIPNTLHVGIVV